MVMEKADSSRQDRALVMQFINHDPSLWSTDVSL